MMRDDELQAEGVGRNVIDAIMQSRPRKRTIYPDVPAPPKRGLRAILAYLNTIMDPNYMSRGDRKVLESAQERRARDEALRAISLMNRPRRPLPPLYTAETAPMLTEEEIAEFGIERGYAGGGKLPGYQEGGEIDEATQQVTESFVSPEVAPAYAQLTDRIVNESMRHEWWPRRDGRGATGNDGRHGWLRRRWLPKSARIFRSLYV
mgnify:CR=1 FL=1